MDKSTHQIRCEQWAQIINNCLASGQQKKSWCRDNGISEKSFYYWQRILRNESYIERKQLPAPAPLPQDPELPVAFVELKPMSTESQTITAFQPDIVIRSGQLILEISNTASPKLLEQLGGFLHVK